MPGPVPEEFIDDVRNRTDIVDLVGEYVPLKRTGQNYVGLCPFHREKTPSFTVSPSKQMFYCFGCGVGGNVFSFLMKIEGLTFPEAVEALARRCGLEVPRSRTAGKEWSLKERHSRLNSHAARYYHRILVHEAAGEVAREYLLGRGVRPSAWERFCLGFAPGVGLEGFLKENGYDGDALAASGLFTEHYGVLRERFRGRIIFPIYDARGRCLGFGGRALDDEEPKYLNSPESPVFSKSRNLYGLHLALPAIREQRRAIVVEGYMDCIAAQENGFTNTVASLGTAFTQDQARLLLRYTNEVVLAFDGDAAGSAAAMRSAGYLQELGGRVYVLDMADAKDPDEFLRLKGREAFREALEKRTVPFLEFKLERLLSDSDLRDVFKKAEIVKELMADLERISDHVVREGYLRGIARRLNTSEEAVRLEFMRHLAKRRVQKDKNENNRYNMEQSKQTFENRRLTALDAAKTGIFRLMCQDRRIWERVRGEIGFSVFTDRLGYYIRLFEGLDWESPAELLDRVEDGDKAELAGILMGGVEHSLSKQQQEKMLEDYLKVLRKEQLSQKIGEKQAALNECEKNGRQEGIKTLLAELHSLYEELETLKG
jgi:DNA primase